MDHDITLDQIKSSMALYTEMWPTMSLAYSAISMEQPAFQSEEQPLGCVVGLTASKIIL
jgi:hypothetical protein